MGFDNTGANYGVVDVETWNSLGLIYRTQADIDAGVNIITSDGTIQFFDVSIPFNNLLNSASNEAESNKYNLFWFYGKVNHYMDWDIKEEPSWNKTLNITYPGRLTYVFYDSMLYTPADLGNVLYGYSGTAAGLSKDLLFAGSLMALETKPGEPTAKDITHELTIDRLYIEVGVKLYEKTHQ